MDYLLRSKGLYWSTLAKEIESIDYENKFKWVNKNGKTHGLIGMSISPDLIFHLQGIDDPNDAWTKLETVFGKNNIIRAHQFENNLMNLSPKYFPCTEDYLSKLKTIKILCIE
jgi:hypothetical protein